MDMRMAGHSHDRAQMPNARGGNLVEFTCLSAAQVLAVGRQARDIKKGVHSILRRPLLPR
jgi:hypothetical protein